MLMIPYCTPAGKPSGPGSDFRLSIGERITKFFSDVSEIFPPAAAAASPSCVYKGVRRKQPDRTTDNNNSGGKIK
jgi:hypothetical protein